MTCIPIETLDDKRLDAYVRLTDVQLRSRIEPERGLFIAESAEVIGRALDAGQQPLSLLTDQKHLPGLAPTIEKLKAASPDAPIFVGHASLLEQLTGFELTRGALAAFKRPAERSLADVLASAHLVAVLENIRNHTNVGALFRSAAGLGADAVLVSPACYDPLYRRAIRVSMGTVFQIPWARIGTDPHNWADEGVAQLHEFGFTAAAFTLRDNSIRLDDPRLRACEKLALIFGTEGAGLAESTISACDYSVRIPMQHGVDSLNVAASAAVAFWELRR